MSRIVTVNGEQVKRMNLNVPVELHNRFKSVTASEGKNMTDVLLKFIRSYVDEHVAKPKVRRR
ncbi:MAG TPA: plasmid partition protein ParG [Terracidiphilus sp.]|nr:plasmid partition protein ParG [Terracidiphilus sp.]